VAYSSIFLLIGYFLTIISIRSMLFFIGLFGLMIMMPILFVYYSKPEDRGY